MAVWTELTFAFESLLTSTKMTQLDNNLDAIAEGASGAPKIQTAAIQDGAVNVDKLAYGINGESVGFRADTVDGYHASSGPQPNKLLAMNGSGDLALGGNSIVSCVNIWFGAHLVPASGHQLTWRLFSHAIDTGANVVSMNHNMGAGWQLKIKGIIVGFWNNTQGSFDTSDYLGYIGERIGVRVSSTSVYWTYGSSVRSDGGTAYAIIFYQI